MYAFSTDHEKERKYSNDSKIVDLSLLPSGQSMLKLHSNRANFVAKIWKSAGDPQLQLPVKWMYKAFPDNIKGLLLGENDEETTSQFGADDDTDDRKLTGKKFIQSN